MMFKAIVPLTQIRKLQRNMSCIVATSIERAILLLLLLWRQQHSRRIRDGSDAVFAQLAFEVGDAFLELGGGPGCVVWCF